MVCWDLLANQNVPGPLCVLGRTDSALGSVAIKSSPHEEGTEGSGTAEGGAVVLPKVPWQECPGVGDSPAAAERHHPLCAAGLSRRQKVVQEMNQLVMIIMVLYLS